MGSVNVAGPILMCWKAGGHGEYPFLQVLQNSCNSGFVKLGQLLEKERLLSYINKFSFGGKTGTAQKAQNGKYLVNNYIMPFVGIVSSNA